jgi:hypothetical protein
MSEPELKPRILFLKQVCLSDGPMYDLSFFQLLCCNISMSSVDLDRSIGFYHGIFTEALREMKVSLAFSVEEMREEFEDGFLLSMMHIISGAPVWCFGPESNPVSRRRIRQAILNAYSRNLGEFTPTHQSS